MLFFFYLQKRAVQVITNSRASSAPLFTELGMLDIIQANLIQIAIFIFHYYKQLSVLPMFLNFSNKSQVHGYSAKTASSYRSDYCSINLKKEHLMLKSNSRYSIKSANLWNSSPGVLLTSSQIMLNCSCSKFIRVGLF